GQLLAWRQLSAAGYWLAANPANTFFYLLTALHGLHVAGGLAALGRVTVRAWRGSDAGRLALSVELCATYWHFLLVIWL
ncbi:cytochrome c oxidase subunit 3, partial [Acinetobacter baumannii]